MARIVVIGSVALDEIIKLHQPLREGRHLAGTAGGMRLGGGAACTAAPLAYAGHQVTVIGSVGRDDTGRELITELATTGVDISQIAFLNQPTTRSLILVDERGERTVVNLCRTHQEDPPRRFVAAEADCVYVRSRRTDLAPLMQEKAETSLVIAHVPPSQDGARPAHILVVSASDVDADVLDDPLAAGRRIAGDMLQWMVVTHGADGVAAYASDHVVRVPAVPAEPVDTTGAGDTFSAGLVHALMSGAPMESALETAVAWGAAATEYDSSVLPASAVSRLL